MTLTAGLRTLTRPLVLPKLPALTRVPAGLQNSEEVADGLWLTSAGRYGVEEPWVFSRSLLEARLTGRALIIAEYCQIAVMLDGIGFHLRRCRIGSIDRPDGTHRRPTEDGIRPCPLPGSDLEPLGSTIVDCDIVNTDGRNGSVHMDGVQIWMGGKLLIKRTRIDGWWQAGVMLKSDWGPIDDVTIDGCSIAGANYFQIRCIDGGYGRPTNVTVTNCVLAPGVKGGANPMNSGNDRCSVPSQTRYVRTEAERLDPTWIVFDGNVYPDGTEVVPPGGWIS